MKALLWSDVHLDTAEPFVLVRASTSKNKKTEPIPLHDELAQALRAYQGFRGFTSGKVFRHGVPTAKSLRRDLAACGIAAENDAGARVDFHALRHTYCTIMQRHGVAPRVAQQVMRHSDARLTEKAYTDVNLLPIFAELRKVKVPSLGASLNFGKTRPNPSQPVQTEVVEVGTPTGTEAP